MMLGASFGAADGGILVAVIVLLGLSAILSLAETGLVRTSRARARSLVEARRHGARSLERLTESPEHFLAPVLLLVLICQLVAATLVGVEASRLFGALGVVIATVFEVIVIFVVGEAVPKQWAVRHADRAALFAAPLVTTLIAFPPIRLVSGVLIGLAHLLTPGRKGGIVEPDVTESELLALADVAVDEEVIEDDERSLITQIIEFGDTIVREVMRPRPDVIALEASLTAEEALERAMISGLSRLPVYNRNVDDILGIAYTRDLMRTIRDGQGLRSVGEIARPAHYVPETKRVAPLLREMQGQQFHLAVVVDEYGGTAGVVTLEDLIEELIGEIADEFDAHEPLIESLGEDVFRVSGRMAIDEVNELTGAELPVGDWDTIGGLVLHLRGQVPAEGEAISWGNLQLVAERVQRRRIGAVRLVGLASRSEEQLDDDGGYADVADDGSDEEPSYDEDPYDEALDRSSDERAADQRADREQWRDERGANADAPREGVAGDASSYRALGTDGSDGSHWR
ncbi:MAG: domain containing protein [Acidimicrobiaceae bacterium]|nr:domain containing protein [Acidimicrobiaceae bacterium]